MHGIISESDQIALYLERAKALIDHPDKWVQEAYEHKGRRCALQALRDVASDRLLNKLKYTLANIDESNEPDSVIANFNDKHSHAEVMNLFDTAIARVRSLSVLRTSV